MEHPEIFSPADSYEKKLDTLQPIYPLTAGLTNNAVMKAVRQALDYLELQKEILPGTVRMKYGRTGKRTAVVHCSGRRSAILSG